MPTGKPTCGLGGCRPPRPPAPLFAAVRGGVLAGSGLVPLRVGASPPRTLFDMSCSSVFICFACPYFPPLRAGRGGSPRPAVGAPAPPLLARGAPAPSRPPRSLWSRPASVVGASGERYPPTGGVFLGYRAGGRLRGRGVAGRAPLRPRSASARRSLSVASRPRFRSPSRARCSFLNSLGFPN